MKVISGTAGGLKLFSPKGTAIRPTAGMIKEALFSMLSGYLDGASFLDLYAGTGAVGIEALSRGASRAIFVDISANSLACVKRNLEHSGFYSKANVVRSDALFFLKKREESFDIIFMDPPYSKDCINSALKLILKHGILNPGGLCAAEYSVSVKLNAEGFDILKNKRYNNTNLVIYKAA